MKKILCSIIAGFAFASAQAAEQPGVIVTTWNAGSKTIISFELDNTAEVRAMDISLPLTGVKKAQVGLGSCSKGLKGVAACNFVDGQFKLSAADLDPLPSGMIGFIEVAGSVSIPKSAGVKVQAYTDSTSQIQAEVLQDSKPGSQWVGLEVHDK